MNLSPIYTEKTECQDCYKCLRACPLKSIAVSQGTATILVEECLFCGECKRVCPANAKRVRDDLPRLRKMLSDKEKIYASLAPSWICEFPDISLSTIIVALKKIGITEVSETAHGADRVSALITKEIHEKSATQKLFISTACPVIVRYIQRNQQDLLNYLVDVPSPLHVHAIELKKIAPKNAKIVFIGPCAAKKCESDENPDIIDLSISFSEVLQLLKELGINDLSTFSNEKDEPIFQRPGKGMLYPINSGMIESLKSFSLEKTNPNLRYINASGLTEVIQILKDIDLKHFEEPIFLELLSCFGGCLNGPLMRTKSGLLNKQIDVEKESLSFSKNPSIDLQENPTKNWSYVNPENVFISAEQITEALRQVGKVSPENELNCSGCGYDSCRDFAKAFVLKKAERTMCVSYMRCLAQKKAAGLMCSMPSGVAIVNVEGNIMEANLQFAKLIGGDVETIYDVCDGLEGAAMKNIFPEVIPYVENLLESKDIQHLNRVIQHGKKVFHVTIFVIENDAVAGIIIQDTTQPFIQRDRLIEQAKTMIEKHLATVQNIAYLLGENAAESETILNNMIQTFSNGDTQ